MYRNLLKPTLITYLAVIALITYGFFSQAINMRWLFNSDSAYLPAVFSDVFLNHHNFFSWNLTPAPYFFPDMLIFFAINAIINNIFNVFLIFAVIQCCLTLFLASKVAFFITKKQSAVWITHIAFLVILIFLTLENTPVYNFILINTFHFGNFINGLLIIFLLAHYLQNPSRKNALFLFLLCAISAASDLFILLNFIIPIIISYYITRNTMLQPNISRKKLLAQLLLGCLSGIAIKCLLTTDASSVYVFSHTNISWQKINDFLNVVTYIFHKNPNAGIWAIIFYFYIFIKCCIEAKKTHLNHNFFNFFIKFLAFFILISALLSCGNIVISNLNGLKIDSQSFRYITNVYWFPIVFFWLPFYHLLDKFIFRAILGCGLCLIFILAFGKCWQLRSITKAEYYPSLVQCIDNNIHQYNSIHIEKIKHGISGYWQAKLIEIFSKEHLLISAYKRDLSKDLIINTPEKFRKHYDFAILDQKLNVDQKLHTSPNEDLLKLINGKPELEFYCGARFKIIIYGKDKLHVEKKENQ